MPGRSTQRPEMRELVLSPQEHLVAGGPAEELEQQIQSSFRQGVQSVLVDLRAVPAIDSAGVRALVRGHTTAERLGRRFCLVGPNAKVRDVLRLSMLEHVFTISDSVTVARERPFPWSTVITIAGVLLVGIGLVVTGYLLPAGADGDSGAAILTGAESSSAQRWHSPMFELAKLIVAAVVGMLVTIVQRQYRSDRAGNPTLEQAQVLLCVSGALMMI